MLRRRAGSLGRMALEVAHQAAQDCADIDIAGVPVVFCSRHGDVVRAVALLEELAHSEAVSPTGFGLAVHNATAGLFSIARTDLANHMALAGGMASVEHGVVEACGLLADGAAEVLLVVYDEPLPAALTHFADCAEQPHAWAWRMSAPLDGAEVFGLECAQADAAREEPAGAANPGSLDVLHFLLSGAARLQRRTGAQLWTWGRE